MCFFSGSFFEPHPLLTCTWSVVKKKFFSVNDVNYRELEYLTHTEISLPSRAIGKGWRKAGGWEVDSVEDEEDELRKD